MQSKRGELLNAFRIRKKIADKPRTDTKERDELGRTKEV
jgi:hypothetical protein